MGLSVWQRFPTRHLRPGRGVVAAAAAFVVLVLAASLAAPAATAQDVGAGSIVFVRDFNVWIMPADDPAAARPVTTDGVSGAAYTLARQDDEGRILAVFSDDGSHDVLVHMDQSGNRLGDPFRPFASYWRIPEVALNPAGEIAAFTSDGPCDGGPPRASAPPICFAVDFTYADGRDSSAISNPMVAGSPSWFSSTEMIMDALAIDGDPAIDRYALGDAEPESWFGTCPGFLDEETFEFLCDVALDPEITRAHDRLVYAVGSDASNDIPTQLRVFEMAGPPPAQPVSDFHECDYEGPATGDEFAPTTGEFLSPSWSPDGDGLVWELGSFDETVPHGAGLYRATGFNTAGCAAFATAQPVLPGGSSPDWGPADVGPVLEPSPSPSPSPSPDPGSLPVSSFACPEGQVPPGGFADTAGNVHGSNIDCIVWWGITRGLTATQYGPDRDVRRDQMASFLARMIENAGGTLPPAEGQGFTDIAGNLHEDNINRLAAAGVARGVSPTAFSPAASVRRDQMASFLVRAYENLTGETLTASRDHFADIPGNSHRTNINKAAEAGIAAGTSATTFAPERAVRRDQMASFLARTLGVAVERGHATPPS